MWCGRLARLYDVTQYLLKRGAARQAPGQIYQRRTPPAGIRWRSTAAVSARCAWNLHRDYFELQYADTCARFDFVWLRDHCRSASCYNLKTNQRSLDTASVDLDIKPTHVRVEGSTLYLTWPDGHLTVYSLDWLIENSHERQQKKAQLLSLWNTEVYQLAQVAPVSYQRLLKADEGLRELLQNFLLYGVAFVDGVPATEEATEDVAQRVTLIRETFYGRSWSISNDLSRDDVGFSSEALDYHTDGSNMQEPLSVLLFHCLKHDGVGGRTLLVDGFYAADQIRQQNPEHFELLSKVPVRHEYTENEPKIHLFADAPVLSIHPITQEPYLIRYNNYDRSPINSVAYDVVHRWYAAHRSFTTEIRRPENKLMVKLEPGTVLFVDNWRIIHGRESIRGSRLLFGFFLFRDDLLNKARFLGLEA